MHPRLALSAAALIALLGCANQPDVAGTTHVGRVQGVFVEQYPGVFVDQRVADAPGKPTWAHVTFVQPLANGRKFATALVRAGQVVQPGDVVEIRLGTPTPSVAVAQEPSQVTAVIAKHGTATTRRFDHPEAQSHERLSQASD